MKRPIIQWLGLAGILSFLSYALAVAYSPSAYPGYDWMAQAVSDLSAESAPSKALWRQLSAFHGVGSQKCMTCLVVYVSEHKTGSRLFRSGIYLFAIMNLVSSVGYSMFPLADSGNEIQSFQEIMHIVVTIAVVLLSIVSLILLILAGRKDQGTKGIGRWAMLALAMMVLGAIGTNIVPARYFGVMERFSVFAAVGFTAILGLYLFFGFPNAKTEK